MTEPSLFVLGTEAGGLLDMLRYVRHTTIKAVEGLTASQLDHRFDAQSNSIGALLLHVAAVESWYQVNSFDVREWTAEEESKWLTWVDLAPHEPLGQPLQFYLDTLASVRARTERELRARDEEWLLR